MDYNSTQLSESLNIPLGDFSSLMALTGSLMGFVLCFFTVYLILEIGKGQ